MVDFLPGCGGASRVDKLIELFAREGEIPYPDDCVDIGYTKDQCKVLRDVTGRVADWNSIKEVEGEITEAEAEKMRQAGIPEPEIAAIKERATPARIDHLIDAYQKEEVAGVKINYIRQLGIVGRRDKDKVSPIIRGILSDPHNKEEYDTQFQAVEALGDLNDLNSIPLLENIALSGAYAGGVQAASVRVLCGFGDTKLPEIFLNGALGGDLASACRVEDYNAQFSDKAQLSKGIEDMLKVKGSNFSSNPVGEFAVGLLKKHAGELGDSEVIRLANIGISAHSSDSYSDGVIRGKVFKAMETLPDSSELKEFLKSLAVSSGVGDDVNTDVNTLALSEIARRGYKDLLPYLFAVDSVRNSIPIFGASYSSYLITEKSDNDYRRETLAKFGEDILPFLEPIVKHDNSESVRADAVKLISRIAGEKAVNLLTLAMDDPVENVRRLAANALAIRGKIEVLKSKLKSDRPEVRRAAISAIPNYGDIASTYPLILNSARSDKDETVKAMARKLIKTICAKNQDFCSDKLIEMLIEATAR